jgi:hypothetical protein
VETDVAEQVDLESLLDEVLPCAGIEFEETDEYGNTFRTPCPNPAEWTRKGHCSKDSVYCTPCKTLLSDWSRHGWVRCADCNAIVWPEMLNWIKI